MEVGRPLKNRRAAGGTGIEADRPPAEYRGPSAQLSKELGTESRNHQHVARADEAVLRSDSTMLRGEPPRDKPRNSWNRQPQGHARHEKTRAFRDQRRSRLKPSSIYPTIGTEATRER